MSLERNELDEYRERVKDFSPEIQTPLQFVKDFSDSAKNATERVWMQCMDFEMGHAEGTVKNALMDAGRRGVDTQLVIDQFAISMVNDRVKWIPKRGQVEVEQEEKEREDRDMFGQFAKDKVKVTVTNSHMGTFFPLNLIPASPFPVFGRNHMKIHIVDDTAWFGGVNVASDHFEKADFMVKIREPRVVDALASIFPMVNENRPKQDLKIEAGPEFTVLVDRGMPFSSIISQEALGMISNAKNSIQYISQLPPSGAFMKEMVKRAKQGVDISVIAPSKEILESNKIPFGILGKLSFRALIKATSGMGNVHIDHFEGHHGKVHAKMLIVDGDKALWGSHNLAQGGVYAGTQEISMITTNKRLVDSLGDMYNSIRNGSYDLGYQSGRFNPQGKM